MHKYWLSLLLGLVISTQAAAQSSEQLAFQLAEIAVDDSIAEIKPILNAALDNLEKTNAAAGKSDRAMSIFIEEFKNAFNRENLIKTLSSLWKNEMTEMELKETLTFMQSPTGRKFQSVGKSMKNPKFIAPIVLDTCGRTKARLAAIGTNSPALDKICSQF